MAKLSVMGVDTLHKVQVAAVAGCRPTSGGYKNNLSSLRTMGLIDYPQPSIVALTAAGEKAAGYPEGAQTVEALHNAWLALLSNPQALILRALIEHWPDAIEKVELAEVIGVQPTRGGYKNNFSSLRTLGVVDYPTPGLVRAEDVLFPDLRAA
jgi:hypothetical protein